MPWHHFRSIITHWKNYKFYTRDVLNYAPWTLEADMLSLWPPTELAEGYQYETVRENYMLSDGSRNMEISYVHPLGHVEGTLVAYLPRERILIEADLFDAPLPGETMPTTAGPASSSLYNHVQRLGLEVDTIVPIHGQPVSWDDFSRRVRK